MSDDALIMVKDDDLDSHHPPLPVYKFDNSVCLCAYGAYKSLLIDCLLTIITHCDFASICNIIIV